MKKQEIISWLKCEDKTKLQELWHQADSIRQSHVGNAVHLRGLLEISNLCTRDCHYCGIRSGNNNLERYRMTEEEIMACVQEAVDYRYGTVVLQAGEDYGITKDWMAGLIRRIKRKTSLAVTLSLGERSDEDFVVWKEAGADRYLLRFETSNRALYDRIHPPLPGTDSDRIALLSRLREIGYEIGSGVMIGIPGQTWEDLADDIETFRILDLDMIGVGPYIPHSGTPLGHNDADLQAPPGEQVPNSEEMTYRVIALARIACPDANIPSTTALATLNTETGRELGLSRGANIVMPNLTPKKYRAMYEIYPAKACIDETAADCRACMQRRIISIGREVGSGHGNSPNKGKQKTT
ncbi:MAG: [FeFe] hydrogenase H-cluster radical SAM maturase HydE [Deltaproteobacteria bacterium]|nr:[FeFe] hydrogenase H-cluster radical SAM maturase HydE [Deltaproteobacteria bacterium]